MTNLPLVTPQQLKELTVIQSNVNPNALEPFLDIAEDLHLRNMLGEQLYSDFRNDFNNESLSPAYETLYKYMIPVVAYYAFYEYLPFSLIKVTNRGLEKKSGEESEEAGIPELNYLRATVLNYARAYAKELTDYLETNKEAYLLYYNDECGEPQAKSGKNSIGGMYFSE